MHLAFMTPKYLKLLLEGKKTIESRFYGTQKYHPAMTCEKGQEILFKRTGGNVEAIAVAYKVHTFYTLTPSAMKRIEAEYNDRIQADSAFWEVKKDSARGILIELSRVVPTHIEKHFFPSSREGWIVLDPTILAKLPLPQNPVSPLTTAS